MTKIVQLLKRAFKSKEIPNLAAVYLYGSSIQGNLRLDSDIDIAILPAPNLDAEEILTLIALVEDTVATALSQIGIRREVSVLNMANKFSSILLLFSIISKGILIYEAKRFRQYRVEFQNMVIGEFYDFYPYYLREIKKRHEYAKEA